MSSYSEYLSRQKQRLPVILDTRPHRDAGHQTEIIKRLAASGTLEITKAVPACTIALNTPSTASNSGYYHGKLHRVQDASAYASYTSGQAVAQSSKLVNAKTSQITLPCQTSSTIPEINDRLAADANLSAIQAQKNAYQRGYATANCPSCGGLYTPTKVQFASGCKCSLTGAQIASFKSAVSPLHTIEPNVNVA
jgi:hypothetical protein